MMRAPSSSSHTSSRIISHEGQASFSGEKAPQINVGSIELINSRPTAASLLLYDYAADDTATSKNIYSWSTS
jgi:hypothetical protein